MPYIYSTLPAAVAYRKYSIGADKQHVVDDIVRIEGGANVAHYSKSSGMYTPLGVATFVTNEDLELLKNDSTFSFHLKNGYLKVDESNTERKIEEAIHDMQLGDDSSPNTPADYNNALSYSNDLESPTIDLVKAKKFKK